MTKRTYIDASVLITAFQGRDDASSRAMEILDDPHRRLIVSDYLILEVLPKPTFYKQDSEIAFMQAVIESASEDVESSSKLTKQAIVIAAKYDMKPLDALHVGAAITAKVDELVTMEKQTKPLCKVEEIKVLSLYGGKD
jgi:hypothetical protein